MMRSLATWLIAVTILSFVAPPLAAVTAETHYYDETTARHLTLKPVELGLIQVEVRFAWDPGWFGRWQGSGQLKDKDLTFARLAGEDEDRGTFFIADISESKVVIRYRPNQAKPEDAGILGTYTRINDSKRLQLLRKEFQSANDRLIASLKTALKDLDNKDKPALAIWKNEWATMRQLWIDSNTVKLASTGTEKTDNNNRRPLSAPTNNRRATASNAVADEKSPVYWLKLGEATARGYSFVEGRPHAKSGIDWEGEYDDFAGGHVSLKLEQDGKLRVNITATRSPEEGATSSLDGITIPAEKISRSKEGYPTAETTYGNAIVDPDADPATIAKARAFAQTNPAVIRLTKIGHYLHIQTRNAERYAGRSWFDGIYRVAPPPEG